MKKIISALLSLLMIFCGILSAFTVFAASKTSIVGRWDIDEYKKSVSNAYISLASNDTGAISTDEVINLPYTGDVVKLNTSLFKFYKKNTTTSVSPKFTIKVANESSKAVAKYKFTVTLTADSYKTYQFDDNKQSKVYYYTIFPQAPTNISVSKDNNNLTMKLSFKKGLGTEKTEVYVGSMKDYYVLEHIATTDSESITIGSGDLFNVCYYNDIEFKDINRIMFVSKKGDGSSEIRSEFLEKKYMADLAITLTCSQYTYDGKEKKPGVTIKNTYNIGDSPKLEKNKNYNVVYESNNKNVGKHYLTINYTGDYCGSKKASYTVIPKNTTLKNVTSPDLAMTAVWNKYTAETTGYQLHFSTDSKFATYKSVMISKNTTTSYTLSSLKHDTKYYVRIRTYKTVGNTKYFSAWSASKYVTVRPILNKSNITKISSPKAQNLSVTYAKVTNATGYILQYSTNSSFSSPKSSQSTKTTFTKAKLKSKTKYYVRVRAIKTIKGKKYYGLWSGTKSVTIK